MRSTLMMWMLVATATSARAESTSIVDHGMAIHAANARALKQKMQTLGAPRSLIRRVDAQLRLGEARLRSGGGLPSEAPQLNQHWDQLASHAVTTLRTTPVVKLGERAIVESSPTVLWSREQLSFGSDDDSIGYVGHLDMLADNRRRADGGDRTRTLRRLPSGLSAPDGSPIPAGSWLVETKHKQAGSASRSLTYIIRSSDRRMVRISAADHLRLSTEALQSRVQGTGGNP